jgi:hypothetical protein
MGTPSRCSNVVASGPSSLAEDGILDLWVWPIKTLRCQGRAVTLAPAGTVHAFEDVFFGRTQRGGVINVLLVEVDTTRRSSRRVKTCHSTCRSTFGPSCVVPAV